MKEYLDENGFPVVEIEFSDWESGLTSYVVPGKRWGNKSKSFFYYLSMENFLLIKQARIDLYKERVDARLASLKVIFETTYKASGDKARLIDNEIQKYEQLLFSDKRDGNYTKPREFWQYSDYDSIYTKIVVKGEKDYSHTNYSDVSIGTGDNDYINVEAFALYIKWLKALDNLSTITNISSDNLKVNTRPIFKPASTDFIFNVLKEFFSVEDQPILRMLIDTGGNSNRKILFNDNGKRLASAFKMLIEKDFITSCLKADLIKWTEQNFLIKYWIKHRYLLFLVLTDRI